MVMLDQLASDDVMNQVSWLSEANTFTDEGSPIKKHTASGDTCF